MASKASNKYYTNPFAEEYPLSEETWASPKKAVPPPLPPHVEHKRRIISFKVALFAAGFFLSSAFAVSLMVLNIYFPTYAYLYLSAMGGATLLGFSVAAVAMVKFVNTLLKS